MASRIRLMYKTAMYKHGISVGDVVVNSGRWLAEKLLRTGVGAGKYVTSPGGRAGQILERILFSMPMLSMLPIISSVIGGEHAKKSPLIKSHSSKYIPGYIK